MTSMFRRKPSDASALPESSVSLNDSNPVENSVVSQFCPPSLVGTNEPKGDNKDSGRRSSTSGSSNNHSSSRMLSSTSMSFAGQSHSQAGISNENNSLAGLAPTMNVGPVPHVLSPTSALRLVESKDAKSNGVPMPPGVGSSASAAGKVASPQAPKPSLVGPQSSANSVDSLSETLEKMRISKQEDLKRRAVPAVVTSITGNNIITTTINSPSGKKSISYAAERVIGNGSFGVVYQATVLETGDTVAIKKVLQDRRFKNRELQIMATLDHPDVVSLRHCFYSKGEKADDVYLNLVMEYIPETIHRTLRNHTKAKKLIPIMYTKVYMYQICRSISYIHSVGICHRDIKPQNLLLNTKTHDVKLCDFGSAKMLIKGEPNVSYICSRYYRAPELVFEATDYTTSIDIWSLGCVFAELLLGTPLFPGDSGVDQLIEIIKVLGTPTKEEVAAMNPNNTSFKFPQIKPHPWHKVFRGKAPQNAIELVSQFLKYEPKGRLDPFDALSHPFFDELRDPAARLPNGKPLPNIFNWTDDEIKLMVQRGLAKKLCPPAIIQKLQREGRLPKNV